MSWEKSFLGGREDFDKFLSPDQQPYEEVYGGDLTSILKPFTTKTSATGVPRYRKSIYASGQGLPSGLWTAAGADTSGLNPFGRNTLAEGIVYGDVRPADLEVSIEAENVRTFGLKNPMTLVGWGYDQFGQPSPNSNTAWTNSGVYSATGPGSSFLGSGFAAIAHGSQVPYSLWNAGPLDLRWDLHRRVWTPPNSVYAGRIRAAYSSGTLITDNSVAVFASGLTYDASFFDGVANQALVTGVIHVGPKPYGDTYKVHPLASGDFCFIVHANINNRPGYSIYISEPPGTVQCSSATGDTTDPGVSSILDPYVVSDYGFLSATTLTSEPLGASYGGTSFSSYGSGTILIGDPSGSTELLQASLRAGTGIAIAMSGDYLDIRIASGVLFTAGGVNNTITEMQGLTVPLSLAQGGTGASSKTFLDLSTQQTTLGLKTFASGIRVPSGAAFRPSVGFSDDITTGIYKISPHGIAISSSGTKIAGFDRYRTTHHTDVFIDGTIASTGALGNDSYAPLIVRQYEDGSYTNPIQLWLSLADAVLAKVDNFGKMQATSFHATGTTSTSGSLLDLGGPNSFTGSAISFRTSNSGVGFSVNNDGSIMNIGPSPNTTSLVSASGNRTIHFASGYHGDIDLAKVGGGTRTLHIMHGLITGYTDS